MLYCHSLDIQREHGVANFTLLMGSIEICIRLVWGKKDEKNLFNSLIKHFKGKIHVIMRIICYLNLYICCLAITNSIVLKKKG